MKIKRGKPFCRGLFCRPGDRIYTCAKCGESLCKVCVKPIGIKNYCPDCYLELEFKSQWLELIGKKGEKNSKKKNRFER